MSQSKQTNYEILSEIKSTVAVLSNDVSRLVKHIEGNGKTGLLDRVDCLEENMNKAMSHVNQDRKAKEEQYRRKNEMSDKVRIEIIIIIITQIILVAKQFIIK